MRRRLVVEAVEQRRGLLDPALPQAKPGEHGQRQRPPAALVPAGAALERLDENALGALPVSGADEDAGEDAAAPRLDRA